MELMNAEANDQMKPQHCRYNFDRMGICLPFVLGPFILG
jgi:hypothetical protein